MRWVSHKIDHFFHLKQLLEFGFQMVTVLSVSRQQPTLYSAERWQAYFEKLLLFKKYDFIVKFASKQGI